MNYFSRCFVFCRLLQRWSRLWEIWSLCRFAWL